MSLAATATGNTGSTISSFTTQVKDSNNNVVGTYNGASFTTDFITRAGTFTVSVTAKDSRGRVSDAVTRTITVLGYSKPNIILLAARQTRC